MNLSRVWFANSRHPTAKIADLEKNQSAAIARGEFSRAGSTEALGLTILQA
jgi:hypothetical protein